MGFAACTKLHATPCRPPEGVANVTEQVEIMSSGDFVNELFLIVAGEAQLIAPGEADAGEDRPLSQDMATVHGGIRCGHEDKLMHTRMPISMPNLMVKAGGPRPDNSSTFGV